MKRLKLKARPKRLQLSSSTHDPGDIDVLLEQHHKHTKENNSLPWHKWIKFEKYLPLDNDDHVLVYAKKQLGLYDTRSRIALQHYLWDKHNQYGREYNYWMRISIPED